MGNMALCLSWAARNKVYRPGRKSEDMVKMPEEIKVKLTLDTEEAHEKIAVLKEAMEERGLAVTDAMDHETLNRDWSDPKMTPSYWFELGIKSGFVHGEAYERHRHDVMGHVQVAAEVEDHDTDSGANSKPPVVVCDDDGNPGQGNLCSECFHYILLDGKHVCMMGTTADIPCSNFQEAADDTP